MGVVLGSPLPGKITSYRVNKTLHGRSVHRKADVPGHNVVRNYNRPGTEDAVDLFCSAGTPVTAMHSGRITQMREIGETGTVIYVEGVQNTIELCTVYCHLHAKDGLQVGSQITHGQVIGYVGRKLEDPHLHLEVCVDGKAISEPTPARLAKRISKMIA